MLRGAATEKLRSLGHDRLPAHGLGQGEDKDSWRSILRQLVAAGYLQLDIAGHGGLSLTPAAPALLEGGAGFRFRRDIARPRGAAAKAARAARGAPAAGDGDLSAADAALLTALKELRLGFARDKGVPAYVIFRDRSLIEMARDRPADRAAFAQVFGVGEAKVRDFAEPFLNLIAGFAEGQAAE